jgi:hypothetical protein
MDRFRGALASTDPYVAGMGIRGRTGALINEMDGILTKLGPNVSSAGTGRG